MSAWSRYLVGASILLAVGGMLSAGRLSEWWGPVSVLVMVLAASVFLTCSGLGYRRTRVPVEVEE